jgi:hypothetical protein
MGDSGVAFTPLNRSMSSCAEGGLGSAAFREGRGALKRRSLGRATPAALPGKPRRFEAEGQGCARATVTSSRPRTAWLRGVPRDQGAAFEAVDSLASRRVAPCKGAAFSCGRSPRRSLARPRFWGRLPCMGAAFPSERSPRRHREPPHFRGSIAYGSCTWKRRVASSPRTALAAGKCCVREQRFEAEGRLVAANCPRCWETLRKDQRLEAEGHLADAPNRLTAGKRRERAQYSEERSPARRPRNRPACRTAASGPPISSLDNGTDNNPRQAPSCPQPKGLSTTSRDGSGSVGAFR